MDVITLGLGHSDSVNMSDKSRVAGIIAFAIIVGLYCFFTLYVFKKKKNAVLWGLLAELGCIVIFCVLSILIEYLITM